MGEGVIDVFLQPGEYFVGDGSYRVRSLLGSCVSIVLWHAASRRGAMSHSLLPAPPPGRAANLDARFGSDALQLMLAELAQFGVRGADCEAKIFGGGNMFPDSKRPGPCIGRQNGEAARALLARAGIPVVSESLFGKGHRQILFEIASGDVWARRVPPTGPDEWSKAA